MNIISATSILLLFLTLRDSNGVGFSLRGSKTTGTPNRELSGACSGCWPGTAGPCQADNSVCYNYYPGTSMCPTGSLECGGGESDQDKLSETQSELPNAACADGSTPVVGAVVGDPHV